MDNHLSKYDCIAIDYQNYNGDTTETLWKLSMCLWNYEFVLFDNFLLRSLKPSLLTDKNIAKKKKLNMMFSKE